MLKNDFENVDISVETQSSKFVNVTGYFEDGCETLTVDFERKSTSVFKSDVDFGISILRTRWTILKN